MTNRNIARYLANRYAEYLGELPDKEWLEAYRQFCECTNQIAAHLEGEGHEALREAWTNAGQPGTLDDYLKDAWYERAGGAASLPQGSLSEKAFTQMKSDDEFWRIASRAVGLAKTPRVVDPTPTYANAIQWMEAFASATETRRFPAVVNRVFANSLPGVATTIVAESHLDALLNRLGVSEPGHDWLAKNRTLMTLLDTGLANRTLADDSEFRRSIFFWWLYENLAGGFEDPQVIFYGSPGTGKTWKARRIAVSRITVWTQSHSLPEPRGTTVKIHPSLDADDLLTVVQFHPSFGYEEFVEGIRPTGSDSGNIQLHLTDGAFKDCCRRAGRWEIDYFNATGTPLTAETTVADIRGSAFASGPMWRFLAHSVVNASEKVVDHLPPYFFVIDEINRAELSRTFGELMYALEYRGAAHRIKTQYSSLVRTKEDAGAFLFDGRSNYFFVPFNVFVYGTMNTIDRSVESFDFALRRRFRWVQVTPDLMAAREIMEAHGVEDATAIRAVEGLGRLNEGISADRYLGPDFCVGHAYMKHLSEYDGPGGPRAALEFLWRSRLEPLIQEYLRSTGRPDTNQRVVLFRQAFLGS